jgi:hypothetical protein
MSTSDEEEHMTISRRLLGLLAVVAIAVPAVALAADNPPSPPDQAKAYGVICKREPYNTKPGTPEFARCVRGLARGTNGSASPSDAARITCRNATPPLPGRKFGECVASTKTLVEGLVAIRAQ